ncbi:MAG TPA: hypothetical protein VIO15_05630, partial [Bacteroidales bacterium]
MVALCIITLCCSRLMAQEDEPYTDEDTVSVIANDMYKQNPGWYLRNIDSAKIPTGILIDRVRIKKDMALFNGKSRVKTGEYDSWSRFYNAVKNAANDSTLLPNLLKIRADAISMIKSENAMVPIGIINMKYSKISRRALKNRNVSLTDSAAIINKYDSATFVSKQLCAATTFDYVLNGSEITFLVSPKFIFNNDTTEKIKRIEINFGKGFEKVTFDEPFTVNFGRESKYVMAKVKIVYYKNGTAVEKQRYAHFNFLYAGTDAVPVVNSQAKSSKLKSYVPTPGVGFCLPANTQVDKWEKVTNTLTITYRCVVHNNMPTCSRINPACNYQVFFDNTNTYDADVRAQLEAFKHYYDIPQNVETLISTFWYRTPGTYETETRILWGTGNKSGKLRKAIIISDAFDPKNMRDYYNSHAPYDPDPKKFDPRGLYQILNGDKSAWSVDNGANLAADLIASGYDIVFINYALGAGDIPTNASRLEAVLDHLNTNYRDNNTEDFILVGPSMGGIITRYCLTDMESRNKEHHVRLWLSFDSPQEGAYIPISLQYVMFYLKRRAFQHDATSALAQLDDLFNNSLDITAAKQMLLLHYSTDIAEWGSTWDASHKSPVSPTACAEFDALYTALRAKGYPKYSKNVAISNGGKEKLYSNDKTQIIKYNPDDWNPTEVKGDRQFNDNDYHFLYSGEVNDGDWDNDYTVNIRGNIGYENAPGGYNTALYDL